MRKPARKQVAWGALLASLLTYFLLTYFSLTYLPSYYLKNIVLRGGTNDAEGGSHRAAATVSQTPAHYTPHKTLTVEDGTIGFYLEGGAGYSLRQSIPNYFHRNGICYCVTREALMEAGEILEQDCAAVIIDRPVVNIDEPFDFELAQIPPTHVSEYLSTTMAPF